MVYIMCGFLLSCHHGNMALATFMPLAKLDTHLGCGGSRNCKRFPPPRSRVSLWRCAFWNLVVTFRGGRELWTCGLFKLKDISCESFVLDLEFVFRHVFVTKRCALHCKCFIVLLSNYF